MYLKSNVQHRSIVDQSKVNFLRTYNVGVFFIYFSIKKDMSKIFLEFYN